MNNSTSLSIPEALLDLEDIEIIESVLTPENEIIIRVKSIKEKNYLSPLWWSLQYTW